MIRIYSDTTLDLALSRKGERRASTESPAWAASSHPRTHEEIWDTLNPSSLQAVDARFCHRPVGCFQLGRCRLSGNHGRRGSQGRKAKRTGKQPKFVLANE